MPKGQNAKRKTYAHDLHLRDGDTTQRKGTQDTTQNKTTQYKKRQKNEVKTKTGDVSYVLANTKTKTKDQKTKGQDRDEDRARNKIKSGQHYTTKAES